MSAAVSSPARRSLRRLAAAILFAAAAGALAMPARADEDGWRHREWRGQEWHEGWRHREWREHEWREHHRPFAYWAPGYYYAPPPVYYAPPPVVYAPPVYAPPSIDFVFPLR
ncbi:MAG TPA: hypothetical protein VFA50_05225 [Stellaceae bacterium]|nr:hypothetical protein [Stellaceae bacterium]